MIRQKYANSVIYGNDELIYMTTRSLFFNETTGRLSINTNRYRDELKLYRHLKEKKVGSILSSLLPIILGQNTIEESILEAKIFFLFIRKNMTIEQEISIILLCIYIYKGTVTKEDIYDIAFEIGEKNILLSREKFKIHLILNFEQILSILLSHIGEKDMHFGIDILNNLTAPITSSIQMTPMEEYFMKLKYRKITAPSYIGKFDFNVFYRMKEGDTQNIPLLGGNISIIKKSNSEISIQTKRGTLVFLLSV